MRKIFESGISIAVAAVSLLLCIKWYQNTSEIEPLIGIVAAAGVLLTAIVYRIFPEKKEETAPPVPVPMTFSEQNILRDSSLTAGQNAIVGNQNVVQQFITYAGGRKIPHALTQAPFLPEVFLGRQDDLRQIHTQLFSPGGNLLLLVNGEGGVGKTSLAAKYFFEYQHEYRHVAWVLKEQSIAAALLLLAVPLGLNFDERADTDERLAQLLAALADLDRPCLLIIDNANDPADLHANYQRLRRCPNFHVLLTTRIHDFEQAHTLSVGGLPETEALELFEKNWRPLNAPERELFLQIREAVGENTLVLELLSKKLAALNRLRPRYTLADLLADLRGRGLLALTQSTTVSTDYQSRGGGMRRETPEAIIGAMYELGELPPEEAALLALFAVLPAERISFQAIEILLAPPKNEELEILLQVLKQFEGKEELLAPILEQAGIGKEQLSIELNKLQAYGSLDEIEMNLLALAQKGWIELVKDGQAADFKCSPVVQEVAKTKNPRLREDCRPLLDALVRELDQDKIHEENYRHSTLWVRYAESLAAAWGESDFGVVELYQNIGIFYRDTGDLGKAMQAYQQMLDIQSALLAAEPGNADFKNGLAISYEKLGATQSALGNLPAALRHFEQFNELEKELHESYPQNVSFKNGLAISYSRIGDTQSALGNLPAALQHFEKYNELEKELHESYPQNVSFKNGLAISYSKLGDTHSALGNLPAALQHFEKYNALEKELHDSYPQNVSYKNNLAISFQHLGNTQSALGNLSAALQHFEKYNAFEKELHDSYPQNVSFKNNLAISYQYLGDTQSALGNLPAALQHFEKFNELEKELYESYPQNVDFKNGLAISYSKLGDTQSALGNLAAALQHFEQFNQLMKELHESYPQNVSFKNGLASSYEKLGDTHSALGNLPAALQHFEKDIELSKELHATYPQNVFFKNSLAISYSKLGATHISLGNLAAALQHFEKDIELSKELHESYPQNVDFKNGLAISYAKLGEFSRDQQNDPAKAKARFRQAEKLWAELVATAPEYAAFSRFLGMVRKDLSELE